LDAFIPEKNQTEPPGKPITISERSLILRWLILGELGQEGVPELTVKHVERDPA
jgi:hypothetical protein